MPAAMVKGSRSRWMLALATCLTYLLIPVGCAAGFSPRRRDERERGPISAGGDRRRTSP